MSGRTVSDPVRLTREDLASIADLIPAPEPRLSEACGPPVPVCETSLEGNELRYLAECVRSNWISSGGPFVRRFEDAFARAAGCTIGVATSSGTAALHLVLEALGIGPGDEVVVPAFTMIATANAVSYTGARPVLADSEPRTWNVDPDAIADRIGPRTRAIVVVHTYGHPAEIDRIRDIAARRGIPVVEDAAEAHGAREHGRPVGSLGAAGCFSFYGNKIVATGEGGMVTTDDAKLADVVRTLRDHAFTAERHFWHERRGFNYRMTNLQAAVGLAQTERLDDLVAARRRNAERYRERLSGIAGLTLPAERDGCTNVYWMFGLLVEDAFGTTRDGLRAHLAARGIETRGFFVPIHAQPIYFRDHRGERFPVAERLGRRGLYLPSGPRLTEAQIDRVVDAIREAAEGTLPSRRAAR